MHFGGVDGQRQHVVLAQQLDGALGATRRFGDEQRGLAGLARLAQLGDPLIDAPVMSADALARDGPHRPIGDVDRQQIEAERRRQAVRELAPRHRDRRRRQDTAAAPRRLGVAGGERRVQRLAVRHDVATLDDEQARAGLRGVAEDGAIAIDGLGAGVVRALRVAAAGFRQHVAQRQQQHVVDRLDRSLRLGVVAAQRLDGVAEELDAHRVRLARREDVDQTAADAELAVLVDGIGAGEAGVDQATRQGGQVEVDVRPQRDPGVTHPADAADAGGDGGDRGHDDAGRPRRQGVQCPRPGGGHVEVRRDLAIRIDLEGRTRQHDALGVGRAPALQRRGEEADVVDQRLDVAIGRHDDEHR